MEAILEKRLKELNEQLTEIGTGNDRESYISRTITVAKIQELKLVRGRLWEAQRREQSDEPDTSGYDAMLDATDWKYLNARH